MRRFAALAVLLHGSASPARPEPARPSAREPSDAEPRTDWVQIARGVAVLAIMLAILAAAALASSNFLAFVLEAVRRGEAVLEGLALRRY